MSESKNRVIYYDVLNIVASFGVVAMHFNGLTHTYSQTWSWRQALSIDCIFYWAVPIFFMISGATLIGYEDKYDTKTFVLKRIERTMIPFLAWSLIIMFWKIATGQLNPPVGPRSLVDMIFNSKVIDIYWFFIPLFSMYLCMPILTKLRKDPSTLWYLVGLGAIVNIALPFVSSVVGIAWNPNAYIPIVSGYLVYPVLGFLLKDTVIEKRYRVGIYLAGVFAVLLRYIHTVIASDAAGQLIQTMWGYTNLPCLLESVAVFVFAKQVHWKRWFSTPVKQSRLSTIAGCSFGIYLIHMIVFWYEQYFTGLNGGDWEFRIIGPFVAYFICLVIIYALKRIPLFCRLVP